MRVTVSPKLLNNRSVFRLSDLHLLQGDLEIARANFQSILGGTALPSVDLTSYSLACSALIHYRKAFDQGGHRRAFLTDKIVRKSSPTHTELHTRLENLANKYVAHSENEYEQCLVTVSVAVDDCGHAEFRGLGIQASGIALLSRYDSEQAIQLIDAIIEFYLRPEMASLEKEIAAICEALSSDELKSLPQGFAPVSNSDPKIKRTWPHPGKY